MKVIFLPHQTMELVWFEAVLAACDGRHEIVMIDCAKPLEPQFAGARAVVDYGGQSSFPPLVAAAHKAGIRFWQVMGRGLDQVNFDDLNGKGFIVSYMAGERSAVALAEHVLYMMLFFAKKYHESQETLSRRIMCAPMSEDLEGKTLGLVGFGASARELAKRAWAMDMRILAFDIFDLPEEEREKYHLDFYGSPKDLDKLLRESDFLSLHAPLTERTNRMIDRRALLLMKPTAVIVNVSRGAMIDEEALTDALNDGRLAGAGLDVFVEEPVDPDHPLLKTGKVLTTPHTSGVAVGTMRKRAALVAENLDRLEQGLPPLHQVTHVM